MIAKKCKYVTIVLFLVLAQAGFSILAAQSIKINNVSAQNWAGGVCCKHGTNYFIELQTKRNLKHYELDSVWINHYPFDVTVYKFEKIEGKKKGKTLVRVNVVIDKQEHEFLAVDNQPVEKLEKKEELVKPTFEGLGLIIYKYKGKRKTLAIQEVIQWYEPANYP